MTALASRIEAARNLATGRTRMFYGWWIVAAGFGTQTLNGALLFHAFGTYVVLLQDDFGWSRTALAGAFAMQRIESGMLGPIQGWMIDHWGPRRVMAAGMVIFGAGFMLLSRIDSLEGFYAAFFLVAVGASLGTHFGATVAIVHWFQRHRSMALALLMTGTAAGGLMQPIIVPAMEEFGWRSAAFVSGLIVVLAGIPLALVVRHRPEDHGYAVDGGPPRGARGHARRESRGRDVLAGIVHGGRATLAVGLGAAALYVAIGISVGALAGFHGGLVDGALMRLTEFFQVLPGLLFAMVLASLFGPDPVTVAVAIGVASWPPVARLARAEVLRIKALDYVRASRAIGASDRRLLWRTILPNALAPLIAAATLAVGAAILFEAGLAFLGLGDPDVMSWGLTMGANRDFVLEAWWTVTLPGLAIFVTVLGAGLVGDGLTEALDPRRRGR